MPNYQDSINFTCNKCSTSVILETSRFLEKSKYSCPNCEQELPSDTIIAYQTAINSYINANNAWSSAFKLIPIIELKDSVSEEPKAFSIMFTDSARNDG